MVREMRRATRRRIAYLLICALSGVAPALAQTPAAAPYPSATMPAAAVYTQEQLDQMLAPIAVGFDNGFITIQPADSRLIYLPAYDSALV
jgi:hypothetical protein